METKLPKINRIPELDYFKAVGIICVIFHHWSGQLISLYAQKGSHFWQALFALNRFSTFTVPLFLFSTSFLIGRRASGVEVRGLLKQMARFWPILGITVLWSGFYFIVRYAIHEGPLYSIVTGGHGWGVMFEQLIHGKAYFHLYFLIVLIELLILGPIVAMLTKGFKLGLFPILALAAAAQWLVLVAQHNFVLFSYPATTVWWYLIIIIPGFWWGAQDYAVRWTEWGTLAILAVVSYWFFLGQEILVSQGSSASNYLSNGSLAVYTTVISLLIFVGCRQNSKMSLSNVGVARGLTALDWIGKHTLSIYLIHPFWMLIWSRKFGEGGRWHGLLPAALGIPTSLLFTLAGTGIMILALEKSGLYDWVFFQRRKSIKQKEVGAPTQ